MSAAPMPSGDTAERLAVAAVPTFAAANSVAQVLANLATGDYVVAETVYALGPAGELIGQVPAHRLLAFPGHAALGELARPVAYTAGPDTDQEHVALAAHRHRQAAVPVIGKDGKFAGVVPPLAIIDVLHHEHAEDLHRLAGINYRTGNARTGLIEPAWRRLRQRLPWLVVGLAGAMLSALVVSGFEAALSAHVAIAFFMPAIVYIADAVGTQTENLVVRGLSHGELRLASLLTNELAAGTLIGGVLGAMALPVIYLIFGNGSLALSVTVAIVLASAVAAGIGLLLPWALTRGGFDPAYGSGPLATVIQDILSIAIYFAVVSLLI